MDRIDAETIYEALLEIFKGDAYSLDAKDILVKEIRGAGVYTDDQKKQVISIISTLSNNTENIDDKLRKVMRILQESDKFVEKMFDILNLDSKNQFDRSIL